MKVFVNSITGFEDAFISMFVSKRTLTEELHSEILRVCRNVLTPEGKLKESCPVEDYEQFEKWLNGLVKWGWKHITMLRFIDISATVFGLHRAGQDDWDAHAQRFNNRIVRTSTRIKRNAFGENEMSDYYVGKIIPTDTAFHYLNIDLPEKIEQDGKTYVKATNGYILEEYKDNPDVQRGLYMLSIPSDFTFKCNLTEFGHVYKERNKDSTANPEVKELCEAIVDQFEKWHPQLNRELLLKIKN